MFGIGYQEMFVVLVVALVVFGPSRLPELAGQLGRWVRDFRRMSADLTGEFEKTFAEVDEVKKSFKRELESIQDEVEGVGKSASKELKKASKAQAGGKKAAARSPVGAGAAAKGATDRPTAKLAAPKTAAATAGGNGASNETAALASLPVASKADPLVDVSFFDLDSDLVAAGNGHALSGNGAADEDEALVRLRRRRVSAAYSRRSTS